jgi:hypothetical protein
MWVMVGYYDQDLLLTKAHLDRLAPASAFGGEIASCRHMLLCTPQVEYRFGPNQNNPDSLTTVTLATSPRFARRIVPFD